MNSAVRDRSLHLRCACTLLMALGGRPTSRTDTAATSLRYGADETTVALWPLNV
jgi:hypothetical protein